MASKGSEARRTDGVKYPARHWLTPEPSTTAIHEVPVAFRNAARFDWLEYVERERIAFQAWSPIPEWNAKGMRSKRRAQAGSGGAWWGAAWGVESLVPEELAEWWTRHSVRMSKDAFTIAAWDAQLEMDSGWLNATIANLARGLREREWHGATPGTLREHEGFVWEWSASGEWIAVLDEVAGVATPRDPATLAVAAGAVDFDLDAFLADLDGSGTVTATMLGMIREAYVDGVTGRKGRVIAAAGDLDAAIARACGTVPDESKRGRAIAAARVMSTTATSAPDWYGTSVTDFELI